MVCDVHCENLVLNDLAEVDSVAHLVLNLLLDGRKHILQIHNRTVEGKAASGNGVDELEALQDALLELLLLGF